MDVRVRLLLFTAPAAWRARQIAEHDGLAITHRQADDLAAQRVDAAGPVDVTDRIDIDGQRAIGILGSSRRPAIIER